MKPNRRQTSANSSIARADLRGRGRFARTDENKILDQLREVLARTEFVVNDTLTLTQIREIHRLLRETEKSYVEIAAEVSTEKNPVTRYAVAIEAHSIKRTRKRGRKIGTKMKGVGGRKKGTPNRQRAFVLFTVGKTPAEALVAINAELASEGKEPISRQRVGVFHKEWRNQKESATAKK